MIPESCRHTRKETRSESEEKDFNRNTTFFPAHNLSSFNTYEGLSHLVGNQYLTALEIVCSLGYDSKILPFQPFVFLPSSGNQPWMHV